ncbi:ROK family transcriptional regulator [Lederbergia sp. NSJ-179]|uniref:ROK family transcriptional regulator n=1 Tax=Lederbergia sp. NSJ-179 TaxID=2931402 RepID=UPI001FD44AEE|nr:ROK family transcriptional regulator [Lederbergia sp. NSJ-179]MCJ7841278.1 ROK family transcriptional regulator [Lederbergia sp. NSJ-179]
MLKDFLLDRSEKNQLKKALYKQLHRDRRISKAELLERFHVPNTTMTRMLGELAGKGFIRQCGFGQPSGGRPPALYEIVPEAGYVIGVEIARTDVRVKLLDIQFQIVGEDQFILTKQHTSERTIQLIANIIGALVQEHQVHSLLGIGIGAVGPIDREKGVILNPESFPAEGWRNVPIAAILEREFSIPVVLNNGANTGAIAEYYAQSPEEESILYCISGYGIRCGFIQEGQLLNRKEGDVTSYDHIIIEVDGRPCICGNKGCLTTYASFGAMFKSMEEQGIPASIDQLLNSHDPRVRKIMIESAKYYGIGLANMINILHPHTVVLHGKLIYDDQEYYEEVVRSAKEYSYSHNRQLNIRKGSLKEKATSIGAAIQVFDQFFM